VNFRSEVHIICALSGGLDRIPDRTAPFGELL
jgi:hypothetical protein